MFLRIDKLGFELPETTKYDPTAAAAVQELMGGRFGEMSTLNNYLHQSVAMKAKKQLGGFYDLVASITAEEVATSSLWRPRSMPGSTRHRPTATRTTSPLRRRRTTGTRTTL